MPSADRVLTNFNGGVIESEPPYIIRGEQIREGEEKHQLRIDIPDNTTSYANMSHTASIDVMNLIFANRTIRSSNLSSAKLNDKMERKRVGVSQFAASRFIICFTHNKHESIPFWAYYGGPDKTKKVQLQFRNIAASFCDCIETDYALASDGKKVFYYSDAYLRTINHNGVLYQQLGYPRINPEYDTRNCIRTISVFDVKYEPWDSSVFSEDYSSKTNISFGKDDESAGKIPAMMYDPTVLGKHKSDPWEYELETRIMITLEDQEFSDWEYIDLRLKDEVFRDLVVILSPWAEDTLEEEVRRIIVGSTLTKDIKESISIRRSVVEGTFDL